MYGSSRSGYEESPVVAECRSSGFWEGGRGRGMRERERLALRMESNVQRPQRVFG